MTLAINRNMLGFSSTSSASHFRFSPSPLKTLSFSRSLLNLSQKNDDLGLIHRWIVVKLKHQVHNPIPRILTVGNFKIISYLKGKLFTL